MTWTRSTIATTAIILSVVLFFSINVFSNAWFSAARLDLTQGGLYTVSDGTRETLKQIQEPITLRFFFSERLSVRYAAVRAYGGRVRDFLREYENLSGGKIKLEVIDPEPLSEDEDLAVAQGITGAPTPNSEKIYFGLAGTNQLNGREVIPFFLDDREKYLEYDITNLIHKLTREKKPKVGIVSNIPFDTGLGGMMMAMQNQSRSFMIYEQLRDSYDVQFLEQDFDRIPADIDVVMVAHPKPLNAKTQYAIDQFIMRGGRALVFLDPYSEISQVGVGPGGEPLEGSTASSASSIDTLMKSWGVSVDPQHVIGVGNRALEVSYGGGAISYVLWLAFNAEDIDRTDLVTGELTDLNLGTVGAISTAKDATTKVEPLLRTTPVSMQIDVSKVRGRPDPEALLRDFLPSGEQYTVAARITGPVKSAFPNGAPPEATPPAAPGASPKPTLPAHLKETKEANIVLVADSDIFTDEFWVRTQELQGQRVGIPFADNAIFVLNAIENLSGSTALLSLRSRGTSNRPFTRVRDMRMQAEKRLLVEEQALQNKLTETQNKLAELEGRRAPQSKPGAARLQDVLSNEQTAEIENFRAEVLKTRNELRDVQKRLRRDIDRLGNWLAGINILLVPLMVAGTAIALAILRRRKPGQGASS